MVVPFILVPKIWPDPPVIKKGVTSDEGEDMETGTFYEISYAKESCWLNYTPSIAWYSWLILYKGGRKWYSDRPKNNRVEVMLRRVFPRAHDTQTFNSHSPTHLDYKIK